jgi:hypothetical protein
MIDPNELNSAGTESSSERRDRGGNGETNQAPRPFGDSRYLYEIPRPRPEDPPLRDWWIDEESSDPHPGR